MADEQEKTLGQKIGNAATKTATVARKTSWRFLGALFMEEKNGTQAVSLHRVLALTTYIACMWIWLAATGRAVSPEVEVALKAAQIDVPAVLQTAAAVPDAMLYTLWALLGINGAAKVAGAVKGNGNGNGSGEA